MGAEQRAHKSIINEKAACYHCGNERNLQKHHVMKGIANRWKAEEDGLFVMLCADCHTYLHSSNGHALDLQYKQIAERAWMRHYNKGVKDWIGRYGKNYL